MGKKRDTATKESTKAREVITYRLELLFWWLPPEDEER
jgi:hypothetical protein